MAEFSIGPTQSDVIDFNKDVCAFCFGLFDEKHPAVTPDTTKLDAVFDAPQSRMDQTGQKLIQCKDAIISGSVKIKYHRNCRATYTSRYHINRYNEQRNKDQQTVPESSESRDDLPEQSRWFTRSVTPTFDWKTNCFICDKPCYSNKRYEWSMVRTAVDHQTPSTILTGAQQRQDMEMLLRLQGVPNGDLVAVEARYHRKKACVAKYTDTRKHSPLTKDTKTSNAYIDAAGQVKEEFQAAVMSEKCVFQLTTLKTKFCGLASELGIENPDSYTTFNFKRLLKNIWPELSFIPQPGRSDLVCSSAITVGEALSTAKELGRAVKEFEEDEDAASEQSGLWSSTYESDESLIHKTIGVLRQRILKTKKLENEYFSSKEMSLAAQKDFVDPLLYKAIGWLSDEELFINGNDICDCELEPKCLAIACDITTLVTSVLSPKHLGLSVHLHHDYGSRKLIEDMHSLGYGISYTELRHFLTSAAVHVTSTQQITPSGAIIPPEIVPRHSGGKLIVAARDNWDHNEKTPDGKRTTHAMTTVLVSPQIENQLVFPRIARSSQRSLDISTLPGE